MKKVDNVYQRSDYAYIQADIATHYPEKKTWFSSKHLKG